MYKTTLLLTVIQESSKVIKVNQKCVCDFILVVISNLGLTCTI